MKRDKAYAAGQRVKTDYSGRWTEHTVVEHREERSQYGITYLLTPSPDRQNRELWLDHGWLVPMGEVRYVEDDTGRDQG